MSEINISKKSFFINTFQGALGVLINLVTLLILSISSARLLDLASYGKLVSILFSIELVSIIFSFGIPNNLTVYIPQLKSKILARKIFYFIKWLFSIFFISIFVGGCVLLLYISSYSNNILWYAFIFFYFLNKNIQIFYLNLLSGFFDFKLVAKFTLIYNLTLLFTVSSGIYFFKLNGALFGYFITSFAYLFFLKRNYFIFHKKSKSFIEKTLKNEVIVNSFFLWGTYLVSFLIWNRLEIFFIGHYLGDRSVGLYSVALTFSLLISNIPTMLTSALVQHLSFQNSSDSLNTAKNIYSFLTKIISVILVPIILILVPCMPILLPIVFGNNFSDSIFPAQVLCFISLLQVGVVGSSSLIGLKKSKIISIVGLLGAIFFVLFSVFLIPKFGINGALATKFIIQLSMIIIGVLYLRFKLNFLFPIGFFIKVFIAGLFSTFVCFLLLTQFHSVLWMFFSSIISLSIYITIVFIFRFFNTEEIQIFKTNLILLIKKK